MHNRMLLVLVLAIILLAGAVAGYSLSSCPRQTPVRLLFDTPGGKVLFHHQAHAETSGIDCLRCHHTGFESTGPDGKTPQPCNACHAPSFAAPFAKDHQAHFRPEQCGRCHHAEQKGLAFDHQTHEVLLDQDCQACHHGPDIEPEPMACHNCHGDTAADRIPSLRDAAHRRCASCHADETAPEAMRCAFCHTIADTRSKTFQTPPPACSQCHTKPAVPLPVRGQAFHKMCMGCHEQTGKGPWGQDACNRCHFH